jgi:SAM-dependent methyltransferase
MNQQSHHPAVAELLRQADALVDSDQAQAIELYHRALSEDVANLQAHNQLERLSAPGCFSEWMRVNCRIHPDDEIFQFFRNYPGVHDPIRAYLADGWRTLSELMVLLEGSDRPLTRLQSVLEFASGYGRFTRHLSRLLPGRVSCSDVMPDSMRFASEQFEVKGHPSAMAPEDLDVPGTYEMVFVLSLFTHLPPARWGAWLKALAARVQPGGMLVFSVHNAKLIENSGGDFDQHGAFFHASSESNELDPNAYGTTITTRAFVESSVADALGEKARVHYAPLSFWVAQDAVVVTL